MAFGGLGIPSRSALRHQAVDVPGLNKLSGVLSESQCPEVRFPAFYLRAFLVSQIVGEEAALGIDNEVELLRAVLLNQHAQSELSREPDLQKGAAQDWARQQLLK
jgi:hypothetical protein